MAKKTKYAARVTRARKYLREVHKLQVGRSTSGQATLTAARIGRLKEKAETLAASERRLKQQRKEATAVADNMPAEVADVVIDDEEGGDE